MHTNPRVFGEVRRAEVAQRLAGKTSKQDANYRAASNDAKDSCLECLHYLQAGDKTSNCRRVAGLVYAEDICDLFTPRAQEGQASQATQPVFTVAINMKGK